MPTNVTVKGPSPNDQNFEEGDLIKNSYGSIFVVGYRVEGVRSIKTATLLKAGMQTYGAFLTMDLDRIDHPTKWFGTIEIESKP